MKINLKINNQVAENEIGKVYARMSNQTIPTASPIINEEKNQQFFEDQHETASYIDWILCKFFQTLNDIEVGLYLVEYNEMPAASVIKQFSEMSKINLEQMINSGSPFVYLQSDLSYLYDYTNEIKLNMDRLGAKLGVKICLRTYSHKELSDLSYFNKYYQEIFEEISFMQFYLQRLSEYGVSEHGIESNEQEFEENDISQFDKIFENDGSED